MSTKEHCKGEKMITIGSLFSGIGCFELGLLRGIPNSKVIWQCEKDVFCQSILKKHWPNTKIYTDITKMDTKKVIRPDIMCAGFPCQDLSISGLQRGIYEGKKSSLYWYAFALFSRLRPDIIVLENVANLLRLGGREVLGSLAEIGYDAEWTTLSAKQFGAPHRRDRVFIVAYSRSIRRMEHKRFKEAMEQQELQGIQRKEIQESDMSEPTHRSHVHVTNTDRQRATIQTQRKHPSEQLFRSQGTTGTFWKQRKAPSAICRVDDGIRNRVHRIRALGNAIVPQCSEYVGHRIYEGIIKPYLL